MHEVKQTWSGLTLQQLGGTGDSEPEQQNGKQRQSCAKMLVFGRRVMWGKVVSCLPPAENRTTSSSRQLGLRLMGTCTLNTSCPEKTVKCPCGNCGVVGAGASSDPVLTLLLPFLAHERSCPRRGLGPPSGRSRGWWIWFLKSYPCVDVHFSPSCWPAPCEPTSCMCFNLGLLVLCD